MTNRKNCIIWLLLFWISIPIAEAAIIENIAVANAKAIALGNAVTADPPGIDSIHFNPAGLALLDGRQRQLKVLAGAFDFTVEFGGHEPATQAVIDRFGYVDEASNATSKNSAIGSKLPGKKGVNEWPLPVIFIPFGGVSIKAPGSRMTFATAVYTPMASGYIRDEDDPGRFLGQEMAMTRLTYLSPSLGYQMTESLFIGASIGMSWQGLGVLNQFRIPNVLVVGIDQMIKGLTGQGICSPDNEACGIEIGPYTELFQLSLDTQDNFVPSINVGLLWKPTPWFTWGLTYQAESVAQTKGDFEIIYRDEWVSFFSGLQGSEAGQALNAVTPLPSGRRTESGKINVDLILPSHLATGVSIQITPKWKVNLDVKRSEWGSWESLDLEFDQEIDFLKLASLFGGGGGAETLSLPRGYETVWNWGIGIEYQYNDSLALRMGYEPRTSSIPPDRQDVLLPLGDAELFGFGFEYKPSRGQTIDVGLAYLHAEADVPAGTSKNSNSIDQRTNIVYNPFAGTDFKSQVNAVLLEFSYHSQF